MIPVRPKSPTTTTKHPHLSVVQVFKESLRCRSEEARLCRTYITLSSISRIFFCAAPPKTRNNKTRNTRLPLPSRPAAPELKHRCAGRGAHYRQPNPDVKKKTTKNLSDQSRNTRTSTPAASTTPRKTTGHPRQAHSTCVALARRQPKKSPPPPCIRQPRTAGRIGQGAPKDLQNLEHLQLITGFAPENTERA